MNMSTPFIKIPNNIIDLTNQENSYLLSVYIYMFINRNMLDQVNTSVNYIKEPFVKVKDYRFSKEDEFISALFILCNSILSNDGTIITEPIISIPKYDEVFCPDGCAEIKIQDLKNNSSLIINTLREKNKFFAKEYLTIDILPWEDFKFTKIYLSEYLTILKAQFSNIKDISILLNLFMTIKMTVARSKGLNKAFPNGWTNKEYITLSKLIKLSNLNRKTIEKYIDILKSIELIVENKDDNGVIIYTLKNIALI